jgi:hypothetical protein
MVRRLCMTVNSIFNGYGQWVDLYRAVKEPKMLMNPRHLRVLLSTLKYERHVKKHFAKRSLGHLSKSSTEIGLMFDPRLTGRWNGFLSRSPWLHGPLCRDGQPRSTRWHVCGLCLVRRSRQGCARPRLEYLALTFISNVNLVDRQRASKQLQRLSQRIIPRLAQSCWKTW